MKESHSLFRRLAGRAGAFRAVAGRPLSAGSSRGFVIAGLLWVAAAGVIGRSRGAILVADFGALTLYSILDPLLVAARPGSWLRLVMFSVAGWMVLFMVGAAASGKMGSDAMVLLFPLMAFQVTLVIGGLLRLVRRLRSGTPHPVDSQPSPGQTP